eukprot:gene4992-8590_t
MSSKSLVFKGTIFGETPSNMSVDFICSLLNQILQRKKIFTEPGNISKINELLVNFEKNPKMILSKDECLDDVADLFLRFYQYLPKYMIKEEQLNEYCSLISKF